MRFSIRVTNTKTGRVDYHKDLLREEVSYIASCNRLRVEVLSEDFNIDDANDTSAS